MMPLRCSSTIQAKLRTMTLVKNESSTTPVRKASVVPRVRAMR